MTEAPDWVDFSMLMRRYDVFIVDQFGVLRDGAGVYPGAAEALAALKAADKRVVILSNSGKRAAENEARMAGLGFPATLWDRFVTSGEVAWTLMAEQKWPDGRRHRVVLISRDGDRSAIDGLDFDTVSDGSDADLVLIAGSEAESTSLEDYRRLLAPAAARRVPCICSNPDKIMLTATGPQFGAGRIAELYAELGGPVRWLGKPFPEIYQAALSLIGAADLGRVVCIGDSLEHDIAGGASAGLATVLVRTGIHAAVENADLPAHFAQSGVTPTHLLSRFAIFS